MKYLWLICLLFLAGCSITKSGESDKAIDVSFINSGDGYLIVIGDLSGISAGKSTASGDAPASTTPTTALSTQGSTGTAAGPAAAPVLDAIKNIFKPKVGSDNTPVTTTTTTTPDVIPSVPAPDVTELDTINLDGWKVLETVEKCGTMNDKTIDPAVPILPQDVFKFNKPAGEYPSPLIVQWSNGDKLMVNNSADITMDTTGKTGIKWRPGGTECPGGGVEAYAPRGAHPKSASILVKE